MMGLGVILVYVLPIILALGTLIVNIILNQRYRRKNKLGVEARLPFQTILLNLLIALTIAIGIIIFLLFLLSRVNFEIT